MAGLVPAIYSAHIAAGDVAEGAGVFARALDGLASKRNVSKRAGSLYWSAEAATGFVTAWHELITCDIRAINAAGFVTFPWSRVMLSIGSSQP